MILFPLKTSSLALGNSARQMLKVATQHCNHLGGMKIFKQN